MPPLQFIERMGFSYSYDFHELVILSMQETLAKTMHTSWVVRGRGGGRL